MGIETARASYWVISLLVGVFEPCQMALVCLQTELVGWRRISVTGENVFSPPASKFVCWPCGLP